MSHHIVDFNNVFYAYPDGKQAVNGITFRIHHGESVGIVGANGAGKSTLLMLLTGILLPARGEIHVGETLVTKKTLSVIRQKIGFSFQDPDDQLFMTTVYDDVAFGPRNYGIDEPEVEKRVMKALETVGIAHLKDRAPYKLSGGEKRAAAIAAILSMDPDILVMDEPTTALDPRARRRLISLLKGFSHTKIIATHDLDMVLELCERTIVLNDGRVVCDGTSSKILTNEELLEQCGLEKPLTLQGCPLCGSKK
ncbi:Phosphonate-transporting ATPase [Desulfotomaculum nigrificans CO-1-SRB]|uniref:Phosphonate-transporting ATPase n=1 Tax=Desulfotomaculum nigrificans (strain DSM 14880 / VKM B-2319 / CO-1-SRB) TaxID=868595 RepID=F6B8S0_DESCC|nr:ABC transporter ATP-binding protein [Desulfotomaculum nigrificans]AEF94763.1 Phosphonate-transporting ATPase [Desulfotomaculum nigrificans CO-1-SRB]